MEYWGSSMIRRFSAMLLSIVAIILLITACDRRVEVPKVGVIVPVSGDFASFGEQVAKAVEDANHGRVQVIIEDEQCDSTKAANAYKKLTEIDAVKYIIGPGCGSPQEVVASFLAGSEDHLAIIPNAAAEGLYERSGGRLFQMQYSLEKETSFLADAIYARGHHNALLISYDNAFSKTHAQTFKQVFKGRVLEDVVLGDRPEDVMLVMTKVRALQPDVIYVTDLTFFIHNGLVKLHEQGIEVPVYATYVAELPFVRTLVEGVIFSYPDDLDTTKDGVFSLGHQAAEILIDAIIQCEDKIDCVHDELISSDAFDERGISTRGIGLYQIVGGDIVDLATKNP